MAIKFSRYWSMPSQWTFTIPPIRKLLDRHVGDGVGWVDPFAGENSPAEITNDLNPDRKATFCMKAENFIQTLEGQYKGVLFDPPYSNRQIKECYEGVGIKFSKKDAERMFSMEKRMLAEKVQVGGLAICFGWNSGGMGKRLGFEMIEVMLVHHGGVHHDTIVTVERKFQEKLFDKPDRKP